MSIGGMLDTSKIAMVLRKWAAPTVVVFLPAVAMTTTLLMHKGLPAYRHDWAWPAYSWMFRSQYAEVLDAWNWKGLGEANTGLQVHPLFGFLALLSYFIQTKALLVAVLCVAELFSAVGLTVLARRLFGIAWFNAAIAGAAFALSPLVVNRFVAGHVPYLLAFAATPWVLLAARSKARWAPWLFGALLAWSAIQPQFVAFDIILVASVVGLRLRRLAIPSLVAMLTLAPRAWSLLQSGAEPVVSGMRTNPSWIVAQSIHMSDALQGIGYFAGYWQHSVERSPIAWLPAIFPGALLCLAIFRWRWAWRFLIPYAIGVSILSGNYGPAHALLDWTFASVGAASLFRELYHAAVLIFLPCALALGCIMSLLGRYARLPVAAAVLSLFWPWMAGGVGNQLGSSTQNSAIGQGLDALGKTTVPSRFFMAPGVNPMGPPRSSFGGVDPYAYTVGDSNPMFSYSPVGIEAPIFYQLDTESTRAFAAMLGIRQIGLFGRETVYGPSVAYKSPIPFRELPSSSEGKPPNGSGLWLDVGNVSIVSVYSGSVPILSPRPWYNLTSLQERGSDPYRTWAPASDWWYIDRRVAVAAQSGIVTAVPNPPLLVRCNGTATLAMAQLGRGSARSAGWTTLLVPCNRVISVRSRAKMTVLTNWSDIQDFDSLLGLSTQNPVPIASFRRDGDKLFGVANGDCRSCFIVLAERFSGQWSLHIVGREVARDSRDELPLNRWPLTVHRGDRIEIEYRPWALAEELEILSALAWLALLVLCLYTFLIGLRGPSALERPKT